MDQAKATGEHSSEKPSIEPLALLLAGFVFGVSLTSGLVLWAAYVFPR